MLKPAIELTSRCNLNCQMCPFRKGGGFKDFGDMDWDLFTKLVDELAPQSEAIMLFNRGEPFLYKKIYEAINYAKGKCKIILSTNGVLVDTELLYKNAGDLLLVVSCPAGNNKTYKEITGVDCYDKVKGKIIELQDHKPENVEMYVKLVKQPENEGQEESLKEFCDMVIAVEDSNQDRGYTHCTQPDITPVYRYDGKKVVCCRDVDGTYEYNKYKEQAKNRLLPICRDCGIL